MLPETKEAQGEAEGFRAFSSLVSLLLKIIHHYSIFSIDIAELNIF